LVEISFSLLPLVAQITAYQRGEEERKGEHISNYICSKEPKDIMPSFK